MEQRIGMGWHHAETARAEFRLCAHQGVSQQARRGGRGGGKKFEFGKKILPKIRHVQCEDNQLDKGGGGGGYPGLRVGVKKTTGGGSKKRKSGGGGARNLIGTRRFVAGTHDLPQIIAQK